LGEAFGVILPQVLRIIGIVTVEWGKSRLASGSLKA